MCIGCRRLAIALYCTVETVLQVGKTQEAGDQPLFVVCGGGGGGWEITRGTEEGSVFSNRVLGGEGTIENRLPIDCQWEGSSEYFTAYEERGSS